MTSAQAVATRQRSSSQPLDVAQRTSGTSSRYWTSSIAVTRNGWTAIAIERQRQELDDQLARRRQHRVRIDRGAIHAEDSFAT